MARVSKHLRKPRPLVQGFSTIVNKTDGRWVTRMVAEGRSEKDYVCPGCQQTVSQGSAHIVVWPEQPPLGASSGLEYRRHWHHSCWKRKP